jgi:release factor glutamine methyltransferase
MGLKIKKYVHRKFSNRLLKKIENDRIFKLRGLHFELSPGVFHPKYFNSSLILLDWIEANDLKGKKVLELGCGSGAGALLAAKRGAESYAADISALALENLKRNQEKNSLNVQTFQSDLFNQIPDVKFDYILVNPPFYPKNPTTEAEHAWYCGDDFDYFRNLFPQLKQQWLGMKCFMALSEDCNLEMIQAIAKESAYKLDQIAVKKSFWEKNFLYQLNQV